MFPLEDGTDNNNLNCNKINVLSLSLLLCPTYYYYIWHWYQLNSTVLNNIVLFLPPGTLQRPRSSCW